MKTVFVLCCAVLLLLAGCDDGVVPPAVPPAGPDGELEIRYGADAGVLSAAAIVDSAWTVGGELRVAVRFADGCGSSNFSAVAPPAFLEGNTPALPVYLRRTAAADSCSAPQSRVLRFAVRQSEDLYKYQYAGALAPYLLRVIVRTASGELDSTAAAYTPLGTPETTVDREAEAAAIHLGTDVAPSPALQTQIRADLSAIRSSFAADVPELLEVVLTSPWRTDGIDVEVDAPTALAIATGRYHSWDALNAQFHVASIDPGGDGSYARFTIWFWTDWRTDKVAARYSALPGVLRAGRLSNQSIWQDPAYAVCVRLASDRRLYLFRKSWGDCPSGCIDNLFWYFSVDAAGARYVGRWDPGAGGFLPAWWADARRTEAAWFGTVFDPWDNAVQVTAGGNQPTWSPDGSRIAYAVTTRTASTIWSVAPDGSDARSLVNVPAVVQNLEWSPDGARFLYAANGDLWTVSVAGGTPVALTTDPASDRHPAYSPDGTRIAFTSTRGGSPDIWIMPAAGGTAVRLTTNATAWEDEPAWSPDGSEIAFRFWYGTSAHSTIWTIPSAGGTPRQLTFEGGTSFDGSWDGAPDWSPDGTTIAFGSYRYLDGNQLPRAIWLVPAAGGRLHWITYPDGDAPAWSPDGRRMAFVSIRDGGAGVWLMELGGSGEQAHGATASGWPW